MKNSTDCFLTKKEAKQKTQKKIEETFWKQIKSEINSSISKAIESRKYKIILNSDYKKYYKLIKTYYKKENHNLKIISKAEIEQREQLEANNQKLIDKLKEDKRKNNEFEFMPLQVEKAYNNYYKLGKIDEIDKILEILKGEKE